MDPETYEAIEVEAKQLPPSFIIDSDADEEVIEQLQIDGAWLLVRPATRLLALRKFAENPEVASPDSPWRRLTDREIGRYYWFDDDTDEAIRRDSRHRKITEGGRETRVSSDAAAKNMFEKRVRCLEIFLERAKTMRTLGKISLSSEE